jgi:uracil phosphoribosyltransferase
MTEKVINLSTYIRSLKHLFTQIRNEKTTTAEFRKFSNRIMRLICEEGIALMDSQPLRVTTPTKAVYDGEFVDVSDVVVIPIIRAGDAMLEAFLGVVPDASVGKILIQRDEETAMPKLFYSKLPTLTSRKVVLVDPMLATG